MFTKTKSFSEILVVKITMAWFSIRNCDLWGHLFSGHRSVCVPGWLVGGVIHQGWGTKNYDRGQTIWPVERTQIHVILKALDLVNKTKIRGLNSMPPPHTHINKGKLKLNDKVSLLFNSMIPMSISSFYYCTTVVECHHWEKPDEVLTGHNVLFFL